MSTGSGGAPAATGQAASTQQASTGVNESQPTTTLQIRLADGSKLTGRFNLTQTVQDVKRWGLSFKCEAMQKLVFHLKLQVSKTVVSQQ